MRSRTLSEYNPTMFMYIIYFRLNTTVHGAHMYGCLNHPSTNYPIIFAVVSPSISHMRVSNLYNTVQCRQLLLLLSMINLEPTFVCSIRWVHTFIVTQWKLFFSGSSVVCLYCSHIIDNAISGKWMVHKDTERSQRQQTITHVLIESYINGIYQ